MSRFLPLVVFVLWMSAQPLAPVGGLAPMWGFAIFVGVYGLLVAGLGLWSIRVARRAHRGNVQRRLRRFNSIIHGARVLIPVWFGVGLFALGWKQIIDNLMGGKSDGPIELPGLLIGSMPALLAWMGLWWAQYPADRALREQNMLVQLSEDLPIYPAPTFATYFVMNLRLQLLFTVAPVIVLVALRDVLSLLLPPMLNHIHWLAERQPVVEAMISIPPFVAILLIGPEILRRVLPTQPMPDCPLRRKLETICREHRIGYRELLLWHTRHQMGNAAVMGFVPRFRYILMSDLLLETMSDEQIQAVLAHELGHVRHKHLFWMVWAIATLLFVCSGPGAVVADGLAELQKRMWLPDTVQLALLIGAGLGLFALVFGYVSRKFERQADVFAARALQAEEPEAIGDGGGVMVAEPAARQGTAAAVGQYGAQMVCSALQRVAVVNNIPVAARSWSHGSIAKRIGFVRQLGQDPQRTLEFDRFMRRLYFTLFLAMCVFAAWTILAAAG